MWLESLRGAEPEEDLPLQNLPTLEGYATKFAPSKALKLIKWGKLTFDKSVVVHRVVKILNLGEVRDVEPEEDLWIKRLPPLALSSYNRLLGDV